MSKFSVDFTGLEDKLLKKSYRLADVKDQIEVVAFDIVRFKDSDKRADLWQVQSAEDGDYILTQYENAPENVKTASFTPWEVVPAQNGLNFYYKGDPIVRLAASKLGIPVEEIPSAERYLPKSLATNKNLVAALLSELPETAKSAVLNKYPELL